jgi:hypothetical protein
MRRIAVAAVLGLPLAGGQLHRRRPGSHVEASCPDVLAAAGRKVQLDTRDHLTFAYTDQNCAASGTDTAHWEIRHRVHGLIGDFTFPAGTTRSICTVTDSTPLGAYNMLPAGAFDQDAAGGPTSVPRHPAPLCKAAVVADARCPPLRQVRGSARPRDPVVPDRGRAPVVATSPGAFLVPHLPALPTARDEAAEDERRGILVPRVLTKVRCWTARTDDQPYTWGASIVGNPGDRIA